MKDKDIQAAYEKFADTHWRLNNLYYITDAHGKEIRFVMNEAQEGLFNNMHYFNTVLKARQLGFSTFILIYMLDQCLFTSNKSAGVIAQGLTEAEDLFKNKVKFAYDRLPEWLKENLHATQDSARRLEFTNGSSITVGTSLRGGTFQILHISEYGKIAARYPEKAREIKTGALNTVHAGQHIFVESTAEGQQGEFYDLCERARKLKEQGAKLTPLDPKLHFFPWYLNKAYVLADTDTVSITKNMAEYFHKIETGAGVTLTPEQKAWYIKKAEQQGEYMKREYPSTPKEAFEQSMEGAIYQAQMSVVRERKQIGHFPHEPMLPVYTFWDLGRGGQDYTSIWFFQEIAGRYTFIDYHESHNQGWGFYQQLLQGKGYSYAEHILPHDGNMNTVTKEGTTTAKKDLEVLGVRPIRIVPRTMSLWADIKGNCRAALPRCFFNETTCAPGIKHLDNYRREWDDKLGLWKDKPRHDEASHGADAFRTFAMGYQGRKEALAASTYLPVGQAEDYDPLDF